MAIQGNPVTAMDPLSARLASLPEIPKKRGIAGGDGTEPGATPKAGQVTSPEMDGGVQASPFTQTIADVDPKVRWQATEMLVRSQDRLAKNRWAIDLHFDRVRRGVAFSRLEKVPNQSIWVAKLPNGMQKESAGATPNKADDLCNKVEDTLMADPPKLIAHPLSADLAADAGAELATQFLRLDGGETGTNDIETYRWALNNAFSRSASFLHYTLNPTGGGYQPLQMLAHPQATDPATPLVAMVPVPGAPPDPTTGQPPTQEDRTSDPILRYVSAPDQGHPAGQFVQSAEQADRVWLPKIRIERLRREQVRCYPVTATPEDAKAVILVRWMTLADAVQEWPETVGQMSTTELQALAQWRPAMSDLYVVPYAFRGMADGQTGPDAETVGTLSPLLQRRMYSYRLYVKACPEYRDGYVCDTSGARGGTDLFTGTLDYRVKLPTAGMAKRCREIPVVMVRPMQDVSDGDPMGWPFISRFSGASEAEATLWAAALDRLDNELHPHVIIPSTTPIDEDDWADRTVPIITSPDAKDPHYEQFPTFPPVLQLVERLDIKQDTSSGLTASGQGLDSSNAVSGVAKSLTIQQAKVFLSQFQQNVLNAMMRGGRIKCQIAQAEFSTPQMTEYSGEEGSAKVEWWTGEDFAGVDRIGIQPGTGTMMTPEGKAQYVAFLQGQQWMTPDDASQIALPGIRMDLGIPEDPVEQAIEREIGAWQKGPPDGWMASYQAYQAAQEQFQQATQAYQQQAQQAQAMGVQPTAPPPQPPMVPPPSSPFLVRPNDDEPKVATAIGRRLSRLMCDPQYTAQPPEWRTTVDAKYRAARQALTPPPQLPKGVAIQAKGDASSIGAEEQAAIKGLQPQPTPPPNAPPSAPPGNGAPTPPPPHIIHVHPAQAPAVHMDAPVVHVHPSPPASVTVHTHGAKRRATITLPNGKQVMAESEASD